jgi:hypothetical protein
VHGKGLFALQPIAAGERLIEYKGEITSWRRAAARQRSEIEHTFVFGLSDGRVIDGSRGGNSARCLNDACRPNCEAIETGDRVFIRSLISSPGTSCSSMTDLRSTARSPMTSGPSMHVIAALPAAVNRCSATKRRHCDQDQLTLKRDRRMIALSLTASRSSERRDLSADAG